MLRKIALIISVTLSLVLPLAVPVFSYAQGSNILHGLCSGADLVIDGPCNPVSSGDAEQRINKLIKTIINIFSSIVGIVAVIMVVFGGLKYITSGGNDSNVGAAKNTILYAIIGLVIVASAQVIVKFVLSKAVNS